MRNARRERLRTLLARRLERATDGAIESGEISAEELQALRRLSRLLKVEVPGDNQTARRRWPLIAGGAGTLLVVSVLFFAHVQETEIELDLTVSELSFTTLAAEVLTRDLVLSSLGASGLREIRVPHAEGRAAQVFTDLDAAELGIRLATASDRGRVGTLGLASIAARDVTRVWLRPTGMPSEYRLSLRPVASALRADVQGPLLLGLSHTATEQVDFPSPRAVFMEPGTGVVDLDFTGTERSRLPLSPNLRITSLSFFEIAEAGDTGYAMVRRLSTIESGTIYFESLNGAAHLLRPGEQIQFGAVHGEIRKVQPSEHGLSLRFHGHARGLRAGSEHNPRNLMPTWLEWLRARHGVSLFWGTALYMFGLIAGVLRWLRIPL